MARIRTIKPSFWEWASKHRLSWEARLFALVLISFADDRGRFVATQSSICGFGFPHEDVSPAKFKKILAELVRTDQFLELYSVDGSLYGHLPAWWKHQKINRPQKSTLPEPPTNTLFGSDFQ